MIFALGILLKIALIKFFRTNLKIKQSKFIQKEKP